MNNKFFEEYFITNYSWLQEDLKKYNICFKNLSDIYNDYSTHKDSYENQCYFISNILRTNNKIHTVKARVKEPYGLIEKIIRKTPDRQKKYGNEFQFTLNNYKDEINDLIGIRAIHIFKEDWETIHEFILSTWKVVEITANVRDGDDTKKFEELDIKIQSRISGYRSVHYLIEFYPTNEKVIAEIQVRTIFEEGYGEIDHQLRYSNKEIPKVLALSLLLFNRISGCADEMASFINLLNNDLSHIEMNTEKLLASKDAEIKKLKEEIKYLKNNN